MMFECFQEGGSAGKKAYELVSSAREPSIHLEQSLNRLLIGSQTHPEHLAFLLHRVNWFESPFTHYRSLFFKTMRLYQAQAKHCRVLYNLLIEAFFSTNTHKQALACLLQLFTTTYDKKGIILALKDNYPHKLCPLEIHSLYLQNMIELAKQIPNYRTDFLQIIVQNLTNFDTQLLHADQLVHKPFPSDLCVLTLRKNPLNQLALKFDSLLSKVITYLLTLGDDQTILNEIFLVFQNKILPIKTTKMIQLIVLVVAQTSKHRASTFISFLLSNIFGSNTQENWYRIFTQSNFYLYSFVARSKKLTKNTKIKLLHMMIDKLQDKLKPIDKVQVDQHLQLQALFNKNEMTLMILQTIMLIKLDIEDKDSAFDQLLKEAKEKLHFQYFIREEILERLNLERPPLKSTVRVKYSNKFLPSTLPSVGEMTDGILKMQERQGRDMEEMQIFEPMRRKIHKGQISFCSQTVI